MGQTGSFFSELRRRNVMRVGIAYGIVGWVLTEIASVVFEAFAFPSWAIQLFISFIVLGFPLALFFAWAYELTPEGLKKEKDVDRSQSITTRTGRKLDFMIIGVMAVAIAYFLADKFVWVGEEPPNRKSIAVLPFDNMSREEANESFTIGIHDDILTQISRISALKVISRTSVMEYRGTTKNLKIIGEELGVATVLEGGVQRAGDRVRINVQLIDTRTDEHLWADTYDRKLTAANIFAIQSEIATAIANALRATLSPEEQRRLATAPTQNLAALDSYFLGKQLLERRTTESLSAAVEYFQRVIDLDPEYALAYSGLADAYMLLPEHSATMDRNLALEKSEAAANRALALDPDLPEVLTSMGWNRLIHYYDWIEAEALFRRALELQSKNTNALHWLSHVLSWQGQHEEAIELATRAVDVDPLSTLMQMNLSYMHMDASDFDTAIKMAHDVRKRNPDYPLQFGNLYLTYLRAGRVAEAADAIQQWAVATGRDVEAATQVGQSFVYYQQTGQPVQLATDLVVRLELGSEDLGQVYAFVGDGESALNALESAYQERSGSRSVLSMKLNPGYNFIRDDPRFVDLMQRVGLEQ